MYLCVPLLNSSSHSPRRRNSVFFPSFLLLFLSRLLLHKKNFHSREKCHALFCFKTNGENEIKSPSHDVDSRFLALNLCHVWDSRPEHSKLDDGNDDGFEASTFFVSNREECAAGRLRSPSSSSSSENDNKRRFGAERRRYDGEFSAEFRKRGGGGGVGKRFSRPVLFLLHLEKRRGDFDKIDVSGHGHRNGGRSASVQRSETETSAVEVYVTKRSDDDLSGTRARSEQDANNLSRSSASVSV